MQKYPACSMSDGELCKQFGTVWHFDDIPERIRQNNVLLTVPMRCFFCGSFILFLSCFRYACVHVCLLMPCGHLLGKG